METNTDDDYEKRCGEIYLTKKGFMIFNCTMCEEKFDGFEIFSAHIGSNNCSDLYTEFLSENSEYIEALKKENDFFEIMQGNLKSEIAKLDDESKHSEALHLNEFDISSDADISENYASGDYFESLGSTQPTVKDLSRSKKSKANKPVVHKEEVKANYVTNEGSVVTSVIEIDSDYRVAINEPENPEPIRPIRKKTNYFADPTEERPHKCPHCAAAFKNYSSFYKHKARHQTKKKHPCPHPQCSKMFYDAIDVKKHLKSHLGARPYLCNICGRTFTASDKLKDHIRRHTDQRDYQCTVCKKAFFNSALLANHKLIHLNEKRFQCTYCDAKFKRGTQLKNHLRLHENKREYKCDLCNADFNQLAGLFSHKKTKHRLV